MINARFTGTAQARAIGTWTAWTGTAFVVGPLLGGVLVDALNWRWIFGVNIVPLAITLYLTTRLSAGEFAAENRSGSVDVVGAALNAVGLSGAVYALIEGQRLGFSHPVVVTALVIGVACLIAFPLWEWRTPDPMMPLHIFAARNFAVGNLATVFLYAGVSLGMLVVGLFLQETAGLSATAGGSGQPAGPGVVVLPGPPVRDVGRRARPASVHGDRPADRGGRLPVDGPGRRAVRLLDADAARAGRVRPRALHHRVAPHRGDPGRSRPRAERHRFGGQQCRVADRGSDRGRVRRCDHRPGRGERREWAWASGATGVA